MRIECFDNSNLAGRQPVSGRVVFEKGQPLKKAYRLYRLRSVTIPDDYAAMEEVLLQPIDQIPAAGFYPPNQAIAAYTNLNLNGETVTPTYPNYGGVGPVPDPLEIVLSMTWQDWRGRPMTAQLATVKAR